VLRERPTGDLQNNNLVSNQSTFFGVSSLTKIMHSQKNRLRTA
jgi:hypothetical protein